MSITCAISDNQIKKLFKLTYKRMQEAIDSKTEFNADAYMKDLFNKISNEKDADTAAKFIQQVPAIIRTVGAKTMFLNLDFTNKENSILIDYKLTKPKPAASSIYRFQGAFWAEPAVSQTKEIVKELHSNPAIRANYSKIAKQSVNNYIKTSKILLSST